MAAHQNFPVPATPPTPFASALAGWVGSRRSENPLPFADDIDMDRLGTPPASAVVQVFYNPLRLLLDRVSPVLEKIFGRALAGRFADEFASRAPFESFEAQCEETIHTRAPTYFECSDGRVRLVLPYWGDGHVSMLVAIVVDHAGAS